MPLMKSKCIIICCHRWPDTEIHHCTVRMIEQDTPSDAVSRFACPTNKTNSGAPSRALQVGPSCGSARGSQQAHYCITFAPTRTLLVENGQRGRAKLLRRISMVRYWILRRKPLLVQFKTASWSRSRKGKIKQVKRIILAQYERSKLRLSIQ